MEFFSLANLFFLSPSLEFGSATGLCPNSSSSVQENTPWPLLLVAVLNTHQVNKLVSCAVKNYPPWRSSRSSCISSPPLIKKKNTFLCIFTKFGCCASIFCLSFTGKDPGVMLGKSQQFCPFIQHSSFQYQSFPSWLAILHLISQEILKYTTLTHYHMIIPSAMG